MGLFLTLYDQYVHNIQERARQLVVEGELSKIVSRGVQQIYCGDDEWIESLIDLEAIEDVQSYDMLQDNQL